MANLGRRSPSEYITITAEVFYDVSRRKNGVRPCEGEAFSQSMKVECAKSIRDYKVGTKVRLDVVETKKEGSKSFLYSSYKWAHEVVND